MHRYLIKYTWWSDHDSRYRHQSCSVWADTPERAIEWLRAESPFVTAVDSVVQQTKVR
jgi:hypothetical protein